MNLWFRVLAVICEVLLPSKVTRQWYVRPSGASMMVTTQQHWIWTVSVTSAEIAQDVHTLIAYRIAF
jgi:hypothetical protein